MAGRTTIQTFIDNNEDVRIRIDRKFSRDDTDPYSEPLYEGPLHSVPEKYRNLEVVGQGFALGAQINVIDVYMGNSVEQPEKEACVLISVEQCGERKYIAVDHPFPDAVRPDGIIADAISALHPFLELKAYGREISELQYAEFQQGDGFAYSVDINMDQDSAVIYSVNHGLGGIAELYRTDADTKMETVNLDRYRTMIQEVGRYEQEHNIPDRIRLVYLDKQTGRYRAEKGVSFRQLALRHESILQKSGRDMEHNKQVSPRAVTGGI